MVKDNKVVSLSNLDCQKREWKGSIFGLEKVDPQLRQAGRAESAKSMLLHMSTDYSYILTVSQVSVFMKPLNLFITPCALTLLLQSISNDC